MAGTLNTEKAEYKEDVPAPEVIAEAHFEAEAKVPDGPEAECKIVETKDVDADITTENP